jgi:hypothetical protein
MSRQMISDQIPSETNVYADTDSAKRQRLTLECKCRDSRTNEGLSDNKSGLLAQIRRAAGREWQTKEYVNVRNEEGEVERRKLK